MSQIKKIGKKAYRDMKKVLVAMIIVSLFSTTPLAVFGQEGSGGEVLQPEQTESQPVVDSTSATPEPLGSGFDMPQEPTPEPESPTPNPPESPTTDPSETEFSNGSGEEELVSEPTTQSLLSSSNEGNNVDRDRSNDSVKTKATPDKNSGALTYSYSVDVPPGRTEATTPHLALSYNSSSRENDSLFGFGWSLNIPYIERTPKRGTNTLYTDTYFNSSLSGELASTSATSYIAKVESGDFLKYTFQNNVWTVVDKIGNIYTFGSTTDSRQDMATNTTNVFKWMLTEFRDTNNNYIKYQYYKDSGQIYPASIIYSGNGSTDGIFEVVFARESRNDVASTTLPTFSVITKERIKDIHVKVNGTLARTYSLAYTTGNNGVRSMLSSVLLSGRDETTSSTTTLPVTTFGYSTSTVGYTETLNYRPPSFFVSVYSVPNTSIITTSDWGMRLVDINGDGLTDIVKALHGTYPSVSDEYYTYINNGNGYTETAAWRLSFPIVNRDSSTGEIFDTGIVFEDINGDGLVDILQSGGYQNRTGMYTIDSVENNRVLLNTGSGFATSTSWYIPEIFGPYDAGVRVADINGDGLSDILRSSIDFYGTGNSTSTIQRVHLNTGSGFATSTSWTIPVYFTDARNTMTNRPYQDTGTRLVDVNGDGLTDIVKYQCGPMGYGQFENGSTPDRRSYINTGTGFVLDETWNLPVCFSEVTNTQYIGVTPFQDRGPRFVDFNGDGLVDIYKNVIGTDGLATSSAFINTGMGFATTTVHNAPASFLKMLSTSQVDQGVRITDINGDGIADFVQGKREDTVDVLKAYISNSQKPDLLIAVGELGGSTTTIAYKPTPLYRNGSTLLNPFLPYVMYTAEAIGTSDGLGNVSTTTYSYEGGLYNFINATDRRMAGFNSVTNTDPLGNVSKVFYHQGSTTDSTHGEYDDHASKIGRAYRTETYDNAAHLFTKSIIKWDKVSLQNGANFVKQVQTISSDYDGTSNHKDKAEQYSYNDTNGNVTQKISLGQVSGNDDGTFTDTGTDSFTTAITYASTGDVIGLPATETVTDQSSSKVAETKHYYDNQSLNSVSLGNETKTEKWITGSSYASSTQVFNSYGQVTQAFDPRAKLTTYTYDTYNLFPATTTNALNQSTGYSYNYAFGKVKQVVDPNDFVYQTVYDGIGRVVEEKQPDETSPTTLVTKATYTYVDTGMPRSVEKTQYLNAATSTKSYTYIDGLGRPLQTRQQAEETNTFAVKDFVYNKKSQLVSESLPYYGTTGSTTPKTDTQSLYATYTYDPLGRILTSTNAVGVTTHAYDNWKLTITDARNKIKDLYNDAYGNLVQVDEHNGSTYTTTYAYNGLGNLTKITDASNNVRNFSYDGLGRRLTAEDAHATGDGTFGTWTYSYDAAGNLTQQVDPKSQTTEYTYDDLNRQLTENYTGAAGTEITYTYDSCTLGVGKLCSATTPDATTKYEYNPLGAVSKESKKLSGTWYPTHYNYDRQGNVVTMTYPDTSIVTYSYNNGGLLESVSRKEPNDSSYSLLVSDFDYSPVGQITYQKNANSTETHYTYDPNKLYRLVNKTTLGPAQEEQQMMMAGGEEDMALALASNTLKKDLKGNELYERPVKVRTNKDTNSVTYLLGYTKSKESLFKTQIFSAAKANDTSWKDAQSNWQMTGVAHSAKLSKNFSEDFLTFNNKGQALTFSPANQAFQVGSITQKNTYGTSTINYPNAFGPGIDIEVTSLDGSVVKNIKINNKAALGNLKDKEFVDLGFKLKANRSIDIKVDDKLLSTEKKITSSSVAEIIDDKGVISYIWPPKATDSSGYSSVTRRTSISVTYELTSSGIVITKHIPTSWLQNAMYPVYADLVLSVYAGSGDGYITSSPYPGSWDTQRENYLGRDADYTDTELSVGTGVYHFGQGYIVFRHGFLTFDTSSVPDNANISNADLKLYVKSKLDVENDSYSYVNVYQGRQASPTALVNSDFGSCGNATTSPAAGSSNKDITGISTNAYTTFNLNATGTSWISKTGYTKLCLREGHDTTGIPISNSANFWNEETLWIASSEASGTSTDPYLEITYTATNNPPAASTALLTENQTNPSNLMTVVPKFSAIFNDDASDTATYYKLQVSTTSSAWDAGSLMWDSGQVAISTTTNQGTRSQDITYAGTPLVLNGATYYWRIKFWDASNAEGAWSSGSDYFNLRNIGPTSNYSNCVSAQAGTSTPTDIRCGAPLFSAIQSVDIGTSTTYWMQVATTSDFSSTIWSTDSSGSPIANLGNNTRSPDIAYLGLPLDFATTTYYWRVKFGNGPYGGSWSDTNVFTTVNANVLQNLYYTYDAVGNITKIIDHSDTNAAKTMEYSYDDLNRLLTASSTNAANIQDYYQAYSYDAIGNITNKSDIGSYTYSSTGYTNPHAVTTIGSTNYSYDNNGNLTSSTGGFTNTWNYKNQLTQSGNNLATSTYAYDHAGNRVRRTDINPTTVTTYYPSEYYNFHNGTTTKHIYAGNQLIASVQSCVWPGDANRNGTTDFTDMAAMSQHYNGPGNYSEGDFNGDGYVDFSDQVILSQNYNTSCPTSIASTTVNFVHTDHLTGSNIVSDGSGAIIENMDYYPFGEIRIDDKTTSFNEQNKFTGHDYDALNGYSYMKARYQDGKIGRFISQDPVFLNIGSLDVKKQKVLLSDPQQLNSYSYAENNPLKYVDPDGKQAVVAMPALFPTIGFSLPNISVPVTVGGISIYIGVQGFKWVLADPYFGNQTTPILNSKNNSDQEQPLLLPAPSVKVPTNVFPKDPADLLPELPRDEKGRIHPNETTRIRPEKHGQDGGAGNPRHTDQHYHVEIRPGPSGKYNTKLTPPGYKQGDGTGFLPGEQFPGSTIRIMP